MTASKFESLPPLVKTKNCIWNTIFCNWINFPTKTTTSPTEKNDDNGTQLQTIDNQCHVLGEENNTVRRCRTMSLSKTKNGQAWGGGVHHLMNYYVTRPTNWSTELKFYLEIRTGSQMHFFIFVKVLCF